MDYKKEDKGLNNQAITAGGIRIPIGKSSVKQMIDAGFYADKTDYKENDEHIFHVMPRKNFAVNAMGYFQEIGTKG